MKPDGQRFLEALAHLPSCTFESRFATTCARIGLGNLLDRNELQLLCEASFRALVCNLALNGIGTPEQQIRPEDEPKRSRLEQEFMVARDVFYASPGWQTLSATERELIERIFLSVFVLDDKLGWN